MIKELLIKKYQKTLYHRTDDSGSILYFSVDDFPNLMHKEYNFLSSKGDILKGNFYFYDNYKPNHIVVFDHGMDGGHLSYFKEIELLCKEGYLVYAYDHTGCFKSAGKCSYGLSQSLVDLNDCITALKKDYPNYTFDCIGHSWGGYSTMNICNYHKDIKHLIILSGFVSASYFLKQALPCFLHHYIKDILKMEEEYNGEFVYSNGIEALDNYQGKALLIHSNNDKMVKPKYNFYKVQKALQDKDNIKFMLVKNKGHNPHYLDYANKYVMNFFISFQKAMKKHQLDTDEKREEFRSSFDWNKMTGQDMNVWKEIFSFLEK